jgi:hypothetical protein
LKDCLLTLNAFSYCMMNPVNGFDLEGKETIWVGKAYANPILHNAFAELEWTTRLKHTGDGSIGALSRIDVYKDEIESAADEFGVEKEMIQAVLFRELICVGYDDVAADVLGRFGADKSTGLGQIRPSTAIAAEEDVLKTKCGLSTKEMWNRLQDPAQNIRYVAMNLKSIMVNNTLSVKGKKLTRGTRYSDKLLIFVRYNSSRLNNDGLRYGTDVNRYYYAFKSLR